MKRFILPLLLSLVLVSLTACGDSSDGLKIPSSAGVYEGQNYQEVVNSLEDAGFTNVSLEVIDDLVTGWITDDGDVEQVSVGGDAKYNPDARYPADVAIVVSYHTFPKEDEPEEPTQSSEPTTDNPETPENITVLNNEELAAVMAVENEYDPIVGVFVEKYKGKIIEFDGCIILVANHDDYDTRYDILLSAGDYVDEDTVNQGPLFKMEDVNTTDMGISDLYLPDFVSVGHNVHVVVTISEYDYDRGLFMLDPVSVEER